MVGIGVCQPIQIVFGETPYSGDLVEQDRDEIDKEIKDAEAEFRAALGARVSELAWRSAVTYGSLSDELAHEARLTDLLITGVDKDNSLFDSSRHVNVGDLVMQAGRPILIVPAGKTEFKFDHALVGWKDTRETRRAVLDALPLLKAAGRVSVVEIAGPDKLEEAQAHLNDVVSWLKHHEIAADAIAMPAEGDDANRLNAIAKEQGADLIVAGAYGHSRLREWVLGGVTRDLLLRAGHCSLVSH